MILRARIDVGDRSAARRLDEFLAEQKSIDAPLDVPESVVTGTVDDSDQTCRSPRS